jgi:hypothetical protein
VEILKEKACDAADVAIRTTGAWGGEQIDKAIERLRGPVARHEGLARTDAVLVLANLRGFMDDTTMTTVPLCPFLGEVTVDVIDAGDVHVWTCPVCRTEHREEGMA